MKKGWATKKVSEIAKHSLGKMLDKAKNKGEPKPYLRNLNVRWFDFDLSDVLEMRFEPEEAAKYTAEKGDVLICEGGYPGRAAIWASDEPVYFQKALHRVRFHEPERSKWFLYYLLSKDLDGTLKNHFSGAGIQHFTGKALAQFEVPLPPLPEQRRIVGLLDEAFAGLATAKANAERNLQNARALFESHLQSVLTQGGEGWVETTIGASCSLKSGTTVSKDLEKSSGDIPYLKVADMNLAKNAVRIVTSSRFLDANEVRESSVFPSGTTIFPKRGGAIMTNKKRLTEVPVCTDLNIMGVIPSSAVVPELLHFYFLNVDMRVLGSGSSIPQINNYDIEPLPITFPESVEQQKKIAKRLEALLLETTRLESLYRQKLQNLSDLRKSLLHEAFTGELTDQSHVARREAAT